MSNKDKKVAFILVDEYGELGIFSSFMRTCHNMNITVQITGGDASSFNSKSKTPNKKLDNTTRDLLTNLSHKEEIWCLYYQYSIWVS